MKMKLSLVLVAVLCLGMAGCGDVDAEKTTDKKAVEVTDSLTTTTEATTTFSEESFVSGELTYCFLRHSSEYEITDEEIINKINEFITEVEKTPAEDEERADEPDIAKGGTFSIKVFNDGEEYKTFSISAPDLERVIVYSDVTNEGNVGYHYTEETVTSDFYDLMWEHFENVLLRDGE